MKIINIADIFPYNIILISIFQLLRPIVTLFLKKCIVKTEKLQI